MRLASLAPLLLCSSCLVPAGSTPEARGAVTLLSQYNFRGMVMNEEGVAQPEMSVGLPTVGGGFLEVHTLGNMDLGDDTGDAWLPDGHGGRFSEIDYGVTWSRPVGDFDLAVGTEVYVLPNGLEFPFGERGETKELFVHVGRATLGFYPSATVHWDYDEAEGVYAELAGEKGFEPAEDWTVRARLALAWNDDQHAEWTYGLAEGGLADLRLSGTAAYRWDEHTTVEVLAAYSSMLDSEQSDWFEDLGIEPDNLFFGVGLRWLY